MGKTDTYLTNYKTKQSFQEGKIKQTAKEDPRRSNLFNGQRGASRKGSIHVTCSDGRTPQCLSNRMVCPDCAQNTNSSHTEKGQKAQCVGNMNPCH